MRKILIVGGSRGIGNALLSRLVEENKIINISRIPPSLSHINLAHYTCDV